MSTNFSPSEVNSAHSTQSSESHDEGTYTPPIDTSSHADDQGPVQGPEPASQGVDTRSEGTPPKKAETSERPAEKTRAPEILPETISTLAEVLGREYKALAKVEGDKGQLTDWQQKFLQDIKSRAQNQNIDLSKATLPQMEEFCRDLMKEDVYKVLLFKVGERQQQAIELALRAKIVKEQPAVTNIRELGRELTTGLTSNLKNFLFPGNKESESIAVTFKGGTLDLNRTYTDHTNNDVELDPVQKQYIRMIENVRTINNKDVLTERAKDQVRDMMQRIASARVNFYDHIGDRHLSSKDLNILTTKGIYDTLNVNNNNLNAQAFGITEVESISIGAGKKGFQQQFEALINVINPQTRKTVETTLQADRHERNLTRISEIKNRLKSEVSTKVNSQTSQAEGLNEVRIITIRDKDLPDLEKRVKAAEQRDKFVAEITSKQAEVDEIKPRLLAHESDLTRLNTAENAYRNATRDLQLAEQNRQAYIEEINALSSSLQNFSRPSGKGSETRLDQSSQGKLAEAILAVRTKIELLEITKKQIELNTVQSQLTEVKQKLPDEIIQLAKKRDQLNQQIESLNNASTNIEKDNPNLNVEIERVTLDEKGNQVRTKEKVWQTAEQVKEKKKKLEKELETLEIGSPQELELELYETLEDMMKLENWEKVENRLGETGLTAFAEVVLEDAQKVYPEMPRAYLWAIRQLGGDEVLWNQPASRKNFQKFTRLLTPQVFMQALKQNYPADASIKAVSTTESLGQIPGLEGKLTANFMHSILTDFIEKGTARQLGKTESPQQKVTHPENNDTVEDTNVSKEVDTTEEIGNAFKAERETKKNELQSEIILNEVMNRIKTENILDDLNIEPTTIRELMASLSDENIQEKDILDDLSNSVPSVTTEQLMRIITIAREAKSSAAEVTDTLRESLSKDLQNEQGSIKLTALSICSTGEVRKQILEAINHGQNYEQIVSSLPNEAKAIIKAVDSQLESTQANTSLIDIIKKVMQVVQFKKGQVEAKLLGNYIIAVENEARFNKSQVKN